VQKERTAHISQPSNSAIRRFKDRESIVNRIANEHSIAIGIYPECIPEPILIWVREDRHPRLAAIGGLVEAAEVAFAAGHDDGGVGVEGLDAAEVEVFGVGWGLAEEPGCAVVGGVEDGAVRARGPGDAVAHVVDAAQVGGGVGLLDGPLGVRCCREKKREEDRAEHGSSVNRASTDEAGPCGMTTRKATAKAKSLNAEGAEVARRAQGKVGVQVKMGG